MTKNTKLYLIGLVLIAAISTTTVIGVGMLTTTPTQTPNPKTYKIDSAKNGTTITVKTGDSLCLTLKDFGDGGYSWSIKNQDTRMLTLDSTTHSNGSSNLGDFGSDIWVFSAIQPGSSSLELVCARPWNTTDVCATFHIQVVIQ
jgi:inhibitor of cysteine peptidase